MKRIKKSWASFWGLSSIYKGKIVIGTKVRVLQNATILVLIHGAQTWIDFNKNVDGKVKAGQCKMERPKMGLRWYDRVTNNQVR